MTNPPGDQAVEWNVTQARQKLSEVLRAAEEEPQRIYNRGKMVAAIVSGELFEEFQRWRQRRARRSIGEELTDLRAICAEEGGWELPIPARKDRPSPFPEELVTTGLLTPPTGKKLTARKKPVRISGPSLSQAIIEDRRDRF